MSDVRWCDICDEESYVDEGRCLRCGAEFDNEEEVMKSMTTEQIHAELEATGQRLDAIREAASVGRFEKTPETPKTEELVARRTELLAELKERTVDELGLRPLLEQFDARFTGKYKVRDGREFTFDFNGMVTEGDLAVALDTVDLRLHGDEDRYRGRIELHVRDTKTGQWAGMGVTIYGPELDWRLRDDDVFVKHAQVNNSSSGADTISAARAGALALITAAEIAEVWTEGARPHLEAEARKLQEKYRAETVRREAEAEAQQALITQVRNRAHADKLDEMAPVVVRATIKGKKVPVTGALLSFDENGKIRIELPYVVNPRVIAWRQLEELEVKDGGRYTTVYRAA